MKTPRRKIPFFVLIAFILLLSAASSPNPQARWVIGTVDAPMLFEDLTPSMLKVVNGIPYAAFGGDHLYYAYYDPDLADWVTTAVDDSPGVGAYASLAKNGTDRPFISYYDSLNKTLKFATTRFLGSTWGVETVDATPFSGVGSAIAALAGGQPHISYFTQNILTYTKRTCIVVLPPMFLSCSWSAPEMIFTGIETYGTSIAVDSTDHPHIAFVDNAGTLMHAYRIGDGSGNCGAGNNWQCDLVPVLTGAIQYSPSIALWNDLPRIALYDTINGLSFAYKVGADWHVSIVKGAADPNFGANPSVALDSSGIPHISFHLKGVYGESVWYANGSTSSGGTWDWLNIPDSSNSGTTAIAFNLSPSTYPCILYYEYTSGSMNFTCKSTSWPSPQVVADSGTVGNETSLVLDAGGKPFIAYRDQVALGQVAFPKFATWSTTPGGCSGPGGTGPWKCELVDVTDSGMGRGLDNSIAINPITGLPSIAFLDRVGDIGLGYAWYVGSGGHCNGNDAWNCYTIEQDPTIMPGFSPELAFNSSGVPVIAYMTGDANPRLKFASYVDSGGNCNFNAAWNCEVVDSSLGSYGGQPSLALTSTGKAVISYNDSNGQRLRLAAQVDSSGTGCTDSTNTGKWNCIDLDTGLIEGFIYSSLALLTDTEARISYSTNNLAVLKYASVTVPSGTPSIDFVTVDNSGWQNSLALYQGVPWITYNQFSEGRYSLLLAHRVGATNGNCGNNNAWQCDLLDNAGSVGSHPSLKISNSGTAYISYYDDANGDLKIAYTRLFNFMPLLRKP